jgi:hypothetical protein
MAARCPATPSPSHSCPAALAPLSSLPLASVHKLVDAHGLNVCCTPFHSLLLVDCTCQSVFVSECVCLWDLVLHMMRSLALVLHCSVSAVWLSRACTHPPVCSDSLFQRDWNLTLSHCPSPLTPSLLLLWSRWFRAAPAGVGSSYSKVSHPSTAFPLLHRHHPSSPCMVHCYFARPAKPGKPRCPHVLSHIASACVHRVNLCARARSRVERSDMPCSPNMTGLLCLCSTLLHCMAEDDCRWWEFVVADGG